MQYFIKRGLSFSILVLILGVLITGCFKKKQVIPIHQRDVRVVATTGMIADVVQNIGQKRVVVNGLMGPGVDPHLYKASAGDVKLLSTADIIFYNGLHLESKMGDILKKMGKRQKTVAVTQAISHTQLLAPPEFEGLYDPHVWFDVSLWQVVVMTIRDALIELDPMHRDYYYRNAQRYHSELSILHQWVYSQVNNIDSEKRILITAHDAFNYLGKAYGFSVVGLQGISTESEAGIKDVQRVSRIIVDHRVPAIFIESSVPKRNIIALKEAVIAAGGMVRVGGELFSDAMGDSGTVEGTYMGMVRHNINTIVEALKTQDQ